jgi:hypothetical protein
MIAPRDAPYEQDSRTAQSIRSISPGRQVLSNHASVGL